MGGRFTIFCFVLLCFRGQIYSEGRFNGGFFALRVWGAYIWRGSYMEGSFSEFYGIFCFILRKRISIWIAENGKYKKCSLLASCTLETVRCSQSKFFVSARARKKIAVLGMLAPANKR